MSFVGDDAESNTNHMKLGSSPKRMIDPNEETIFNSTIHLQVFDPVARIRKVHIAKKLLKHWKQEKICKLILGEEHLCGDD